MPNKVIKMPHVSPHVNNHTRENSKGKFSIDMDCINQ